MDNTGDRKSIRAKEKQSRIDLAQRLAVTRNLMSTVEGRAWLWALLSDCHVFASTFSGEALTSAFAEGQRSIGLGILANIMFACPDQYIQAMREANERSNLDNARADAGSDERRSSPIADGGDTGSSPSDPTAESGDDVTTSSDPSGGGWNLINLGPAQRPV